MQRRPFLRLLGASLLAPAACARAAVTGAAPGRRLGIQLYTLRDAARKDLAGTLANIASIGYTDVELLGSMNNFGMPARELRATLDRLGLHAPSTHVDVDVLDAMDRALDEAQVLGHEQLVIPSLPDEMRRTLDDWRRAADRMNEAGAVARRRGLWLMFHSEPDHFQRIEGQIPYDVLVERTDPAVVRHQLDTGNLAMGGADPLAYLDRWNDRYWSFHVKDAPSIPAQHDTELGKGVLDIPRILSRAKHVDGHLLFVEQESYPGDPLDSVRRDFAYMRSIGR